jgi:hypothetical protein
MKKVFISIWQWLFGNKKGVEVTAPLETPTMRVVKAEPQEDKVEAILNGNAPEPKFMDVKESSDMFTDATLNKINHLTSKSERVMPLDNENIEEQTRIRNNGYSPIKFDVVKNGTKFSLTEKQHFFYKTIVENGTIKGQDLCVKYLEHKYPNGIPQHLPKWQYSLTQAHGKTLIYLLKVGLVVKIGKSYSHK